MTADAAPLDLSGPLAACLVDEARQAAPREACGLLVGAGRRVVRIVPTANAASSDNRYEIPPEAHFAALRLARRDGLEVLGAYHSHPRSGAVPSPTDAAEAFPHFDFVIVGLVPSPHLRAWRLTGGNFTEVGLVGS